MITKTIINIFTSVFIFCCVCVLPLQAQNIHRVSVYGAGGLSTLMFDTKNGEATNKAGGAFGVGYNYYLTSKWSLHSGAELAIYKSDISMNSFGDAYMSQDDANQKFEFRYRAGGYEERQTAIYLNIPLMLQFETVNDGFYTMFGGKVGIPVQGKYKSSISSFSTEGYYADNNVVYDDLPYRGFGKFISDSRKGDIDMKISFMLSAELGLKNQVTNKLTLYSGVFCDYGLTNVVKGGKVFLPYNVNEPTRFENNSILNSEYASDEGAGIFAKNVRPLALGIKMRLAF